MATYKIHDRTDEFRVEIVGRFAGGCVQEVRTAWQDSLKRTLSRQIIVNLTRVSGYDFEGRRLLQEMQRHGTQFAAGTPDALVLLQEISRPIEPLIKSSPAIAVTRKPAEGLAMSHAAGKASG